ncbi:zinc finger CCCH domain-containing protein 13 [Rosa sericea]
MNPAGGGGAGAGGERCPHCLLLLDRGVHKPHVCTAAPSSSANIKRTVDDRSLWHYDASDGESSGTDLDHHRRNRRRRQQQPLDLEKGHRDGDGVGSDSSDPDPRFTLSDRRHQDRRASGKPDAKKQQNVVDLAKDDGEMARGFWRTAWGFWRRLVHKARGEGCINAGDATRADNECIKRESRKGRTKRVSDSHFMISKYLM